MRSRSDAEKPVDGFPVRHVAEIPPKPAEALWLVEELWCASGVGFIGGPPKTFKTWLATELALAVASGRPALGRFVTKRPGPVLFFAAEDSGAAMRVRFDAVAAARGVVLPEVPLLLLDTAVLRLDDTIDLERLRSTVARVGARLLVLDPFVRCARVDENSAQEVSAVLGALRALQRDFDVAVLVVHHVRKSPAAHLGQQLRGSGDFAAWLDSGLYLARHADELVLHVEHRGAPAPAALRLRFVLEPTPHLVVIDDRTLPAAPSPADPLEAAVLDRLRAVRRPQATTELRDALKVRKATLVSLLDRLQTQGTITRQPTGGWGLRPPYATSSAPAPTPPATAGSSDAR